MLTRLCPCLALACSLSVASTTSTAEKPSTPSKSPSTTKHATHTATKTASHKSSAHTTGKSRSRKGSRRTASRRGQQAIDSSRAREIQEALIREHYLDGEPSGSWDAATQAAIKRYQEDQGWQSKTIPDSRALIKLGLGPSHDHLLNPETAMTSSPITPVSSAAAPSAVPAPKVGGQPAPAADHTPQR